jgi:serine protease Do
VKFADKAPDAGDRIISVGNPFGLGGTVTAGIVSARGRDVSKSSASKANEDLIQIDAPINRAIPAGRPSISPATSASTRSYFPQPAAGSALGL